MPYRRTTPHLTVGVLMLVSAVLTGCSPSSSQPAAKAFSSSQTQRFDELVQAAIGIHRLPGVVVSIDDPRRGTFAKAYGTADVVAGQKLQLNDRYRVYSVTKTFTATAILQLVDGGQLSLDDTLEKYVQGVPNGGLITIRELLAMRAGIYDYVTDQQLLDAYNANPLLPGWKPTDILAVLQRHAAEFTPPDQQSVYSSSNYILLGLVLEAVTEQPADRWITDHVIQPLGLGATSFPTTPALPEPYVHGYDLSFAMRDVSQSNPGWTDGAIVSNVPDMARYVKQLATGKLLHASTQTERLKLQPFASSGTRFQYGLGIMQFGDWLGHTGAGPGYSDYVFYLPSQGATVVVMVNASTNTGDVGAWDVWTPLVRYLYSTSLPNE
jgi:D-alanyl-D-alanine carboxypeptidase